MSPSGRPGQFLVAATFAVGLGVASTGEASAQCCGGVALGHPMLQTQALQAQLLQTQVLQAQLTQAALLTARSAALKPAAPREEMIRQLKPKVNGDPAADEALAVSLAKDLVGGTPARKQRALVELKEHDGEAFTQALAIAIPKLAAGGRDPARGALAERLVRAPVADWRDYLRGDDFELSRAAALAGALKQDPELVPDLIAALERKPDGPLVPTLRSSLRNLSARDYGPAQFATAAQRKQAVSAWKEWWKQNRAAAGHP